MYEGVNALVNNTPLFFPPLNLEPGGEDDAHDFVWSRHAF